MHPNDINGDDAYEFEELYDPEYYNTYLQYKRLGRVIDSKRGGICFY